MQETQNDKRRFKIYYFMNGDKTRTYLSASKNEANPMIHKKT